MRTLDRYIVRNFLTGYLIAFFVLMGLRIIIDMFINLDEFSKHSELGVVQVMANICNFYMIQSSVYFRDFAGPINVVAAVFALGRMTKKNELVAMMASGISLKRVIMPIIFFSALLSGLLIVDQEYIIPSLAGSIVRDHDELPGQQNYSVSCLIDKNGSIINASQYSEGAQTMTGASIILRKPTDEGLWQTIGWIRADRAVYNPVKDVWELYTETENPDGTVDTTPGGDLQNIIPYASTEDIPAHRVVLSYKTDLTPEIIPVRRKQQSVTLLSFSQLREFSKTTPRSHDRARMLLERNTRMTDPIINLIMLVISLTVLTCRDNKQMKSAIMVSFGITVGCLIFTFVCKMFGTEQVFEKVRPNLWAWLPVVVFLPVAAFMYDSMKT
ncbi:lipopolysaccharide ABC transporter permease [Limihaloglobus sulfuriphilus]|uniref:Lipopolysaccharide ABC transporter permease n=1 Tax=Limihaloglobus sulfuriphilus TaxID=1851148 RepID=A0A1Q2MB94_9BACT|nr:LptF/LptG family permease [Limihaloglobus sulfuriphilus]AQQ69993.1 lipopolysaccharide ABC transporter permease [Limihaloglobus sulfuriphilus]